MAAAEKQRAWAVGGLHLHFEEPNLFAIKQIEAPNPQEVKKLLDVIFGLAEDVGRLCVLIDYSRATLVSPEARHVLGSRGRLPVKAVAIFGASFAMSTLTRLLTRGLELVGKANFLLSVHDEEADARAWLARYQGLDIP